MTIDCVRHVNHVGVKLSRRIMILDIWNSYFCTVVKKRIQEISVAKNTTEIVVEIGPEKSFIISSVVFLITGIFYVRFFTEVQIYEFHISKIIIHHLDGLFGPNILLSSQLVERCTGIAEVIGSNPVQASKVFQVLFQTLV